MTPADATPPPPGTPEPGPVAPPAYEPAPATAYEPARSTPDEPVPPAAYAHAPSAPPIPSAPSIAAAAIAAAPALDTPPELERRPVYAGFWRRFWTFVVDAIVLWPFGLAIRILFGVGMFESLWSRDGAVVLLLGVMLAWLYSALLESSRWQGSLGQQLLGLRVTDRFGRRVSFARATARHFGQFLSFCTLGIGYLAIVFNRRHLALHDWISGCEIVRRGLEAPVTSAPIAAHAVTPLGGGVAR